MMKRNLLLLALLTLSAVVLVVRLAPREDSVSGSSTDSLLLPLIAEKVNEVDRVEIVTAGDTLVATMLKTGGEWRLQQMDSYHADWPKLKTLLAELAQARVVEAKTDKPEYYARLGVENVSEESAASVLVKLGFGDQQSGVLIGNRAHGRQGQYVRLQGEAASALVDRQFDVPTETIDWAESRIVDINSSEVAEVEIIHPSGERILVMRISADQTDFDLAGLPEGREIKSSWAVNSLGSVFSLLDMETVRSATGVDWNDAVKLRMLMFSGVEILADLVERGDEYMLRLQASHPAANVVGKEDGVSPEQEAIEKQAAEDVGKVVEGINNRTAGWAYGISKSKFDAMVKKPEDLLKPLESS